MDGKDRVVITVLVMLLGMAWASLGQAQGLVCDSRILDRIYSCFQDGVNFKANGDAKEKLSLAKSYAQSGLLSVDVDWGNIHPSIGDAVTINATIKNNTSVAIGIDVESIRIQFPCELYSAGTKCDGVAPFVRGQGAAGSPAGQSSDSQPPNSGKTTQNTSVMAGQVFTLQPQGTLPLSAYFEPAGPGKGRFGPFETLFHPAHFQSKTRYPMMISLQGWIEGIDKLPLGANTRFEADLKANLSVSMSHLSLAFYCGLGALIAGLMHKYTRFALRRREGDDKARRTFWLAPPVKGKIVTGETHFSASIVVNGVFVAALIGPLVGLSTNSDRLLQAKILDALGAMAFGFVVHFLAYDLGYSKLYPLIARLLRGQGSH